MYRVLEWAGWAQDDAATALEGDGPPHNPIPYFREIIMRVLFSRKFVKTYNIVLVVVLVLLCLVQCSRQVSARRLWRYYKRAYGSKHEGEDRPAASSAHDGSLRAEPSTPPNELKPLLGLTRRRGRGWTTRVCMCTRIRGVLAYQPALVVGYETPPISTILLLCAYYGLNLFYVLYGVPLHSLKLFVLADRLGSVFVINLPLLYLLAAKSPVLKALTGWSYERVNILHRAVGRVCILTALGHFALFVWVWYATLQPFTTLGAFLAHPAVAFGVVAWCSYVLLGATSKEEFRASFYEVFLFLHVILQAFALGFLFFHHHNARPYVGAALVIFMLDRLLYRLYIASHTVTGTAQVLPDGETVRLALLMPKGYHWEAGQHVFICVPKIAVLHPHPFSIASTPGDELHLLIRARDGFSRRLLESVRRGHVSVSTIIDGPYGSSYAMECLRAADVAVCVAGGSGIAVMYPLAHAIAMADRLQGDLEEEAPIGGLGPKRVALIWVVRDELDLAWLPEGQLEELQAAGVELTVYVTGLAGRGRPNLRNDLVEILGAESDSEKAGVVVCGPNGMVRDVRNGCAALMRRGSDVILVTEKFGW